MKVVGFNGREYNLDLKKYIRNHRSKRSRYHVLAREIISEVFNGYNILEEVKLPGSRDPAKKSVLYLDFFIPNIKIGVEVHGEQHHKFNKFFYKNKLQFYRAKARDAEKREWCEINDITLIEFNYNEDVDDWRRKVK